MLSVTVIQHLSREKTTTNFFLQVIIKFYFQIQVNYQVITHTDIYI